MRFNNSRYKEIKRRSIEVFKISNGYKHIDINVFPHTGKITELEDMR